MQAGIGVSGAGQVLVHIIREYLRRAEAAGYVCMKLDTSNAFNTISRQRILSELRSHPHLSPLALYFSRTYMRSTQVLVRGPTGEAYYIPCSTGVRQGACLSPALFALGYHRSITATCDQFRDVLVLALHDDTYLLGLPAQVSSAASFMANLMSADGLKLQPAKSLVYTNGQAADFVKLQMPGYVGKFSETGIIVAGIPIGEDSFVEAWLTQHHAGEARAVSNLDQLAHLQSRLLLLRHCAATACVHVLRGVPAHLSSEYAKLHDSVIRRALESILGQRLTADAWTQASLPLREGGLGLTEMFQQTWTCYLASWTTAAAHSRKLSTRFPFLDRDWMTSLASSDLRLSSLLEDAKEVIGADGDAGLLKSLSSISAPDWKSPDKLQKTLGDRLARRKADVLASSLQGSDAKRFEAVRHSDAADWLRALPSDPELYMSNSVYQLRLCRRLGLPLSHLRLPHKCVCGTPLDATAHHLEWCTHGRRIWAHDELVDDIRTMIQTAGVHAEKELPTDWVFPHAGDRQFRVDIFQSCGLQNRPIVGDVTIRHPCAPSNSRSANVLEKAEKDKKRRYEELCNVAGHTLHTYAFEQYGHASKDMGDLIHSLDKRVTEQDIDWTWKDFNWAAPSFGTYWRQRLSCCLQRSLAIKELSAIHRARRQQWSRVSCVGKDYRDMYIRNYKSSSRKSQGS